MAIDRSHLLRNIQWAATQADEAGDRPKGTSGLTGDPDRVGGFGGNRDIAVKPRGAGSKDGLPIGIGDGCKGQLAHAFRRALKEQYGDKTGERIYAATGHKEGHTLRVDHVKIASKKMNKVDSETTAKRKEAASSIAKDAISRSRIADQRYSDTLRSRATDALTKNIVQMPGFEGRHDIVNSQEFGGELKSAINLSIKNLIREEVGSIMSHQRLNRTAEEYVKKQIDKWMETEEAKPLYQEGGDGFDPEFLSRVVNQHIVKAKKMDREEMMIANHQGWWNEEKTPDKGPDDSPEKAQPMDDNSTFTSPRMWAETAPAPETSHRHQFRIGQRPERDMASERSGSGNRPLTESLSDDDELMARLYEEEGLLAAEQHGSGEKPRTGEPTREAESSPDDDEILARLIEEEDELLAEGRRGSGEKPRTGAPTQGTDGPTQPDAGSKV